MAPRVGERIFVGIADSDEVKEAIVVDHDTAGNPVTMPVEAVDSLEEHLGVQRAAAVRSAMGSRARVLDYVA